MAPFLAIALVLLAGCGGGGEGGSGAQPTPSASAGEVRYADVEVVHTTIDGEPRVQLRTVVENGEVVMTAIGSDADTGETGDLEWTSMRAALLVQVRAAMGALGWEEMGTGPAWWQVRYRGGPGARVAVIDPTAEPTGAPTAEPPDEPTDEPTAEPEPVPGGEEVDDLLALMGRGYDDPEVRSLVMGCGPGNDVNRSGNIACLSSGFELTLSGPNLIVTQIMLSAAELNGYDEYQGRLPLGLSWDDNYYTIVDKLGEPDRQVGGGGVTVILQYPAGDVWLLVETSATHDRPEYLESSRLLRISITERPVYTFPKPEPIDPDWSD